MKRLIVFALFAFRTFAAITGPGSCITAVQSAVTLTITTPSVTTSGSILILNAEGSGNSNPSGWTITDALNSIPTTNIWHHLTEQNSGSPGAAAVIWYAYNSSGGALQTGALHTFTATSGSPVAISLALTCFSGSLTSSDPFDKQNGANGASITSLASGSITPSQNGELVIAAGGMRIGTAYTANAVTVDKALDYVTGTLSGIALGHVIQTSATAVNNTWSMSGSGQMASVIASFKAAGTGPAAIVKHKVNQ